MRSVLTPGPLLNPLRWISSFATYWNADDPSCGQARGASQHRWQCKAHRLRCAIDLRYTAHAEAAKPTQQLAHQFFGGGSTGRDADARSARKPSPIDLARILHQIRRHAQLLPDFSQAVRVRAITS